MSFLFRSYMFLGFSLIPGFAFGAFSNIEIGVSPPRHEFSVGAGETIEKEIKVFNNSSTDTYTVHLSSGDCIADSRDGTPICHNYTGSGADPKSLSSWISFASGGVFSIAPKKEKIIKLIFRVPSNALPGGHYGIVYLTPDLGSAGATVTMVRQLGVIFQVNVPGELIYDIGVGGISIETPLYSAPTPIELILQEPTDRNHWTEALKYITEGTKNWTGTVSYLKTELNPFWEKPTLIKSTDFHVKFEIPVTNSGNIDVRPIGRIELYDEDGTLLRKIGKESIKSSDGVFLGERIVDYLPINDEGGSVLPDGERKRIYTVNWKGFAYEAYEDGKMQVKFQSPGEYYSAKTAENASVLYPWEKLKIKIAQKTIKAKIAIEYIGENNKVIPTEIERDIIVEYNYIDTAINTGVVGLIGLIIIISWGIIRKRNNRIEELEDEIILDEVELEKARNTAKSLLSRKKKIEESPLTLTEQSHPESKKRSQRKKQPVIENEVTEVDPLSPVKKPRKTTQKKSLPSENTPTV